MTDTLKIATNAGPDLSRPARRSLLFRGGLVLLAATLLIVVFRLVDWAAELLWFRALGYEAVFWRLLLAKVTMFTAAFIPVFVYALLNLVVLARIADQRILLSIGGHAGKPQVWPNPSGTAMAQLQAQRITPFFFSVSTVTAVIFAMAFYGKWDLLLRVVWSQDFGMVDPVYLRDIGFYLFILPFLNLIQISLVMLTLGGTLMLGFAYLRTGGLQVRTARHIVVDPMVLRHLVANAILLLTAQAWGYYLDRFGLLTQSTGAVFGAGYTDVHVVLVGLWVALGATLALICVLVWVAATNALRLALLGVSGYLIVLLAALVVFPDSFQRLVVEPNELELETPFLQHNIAQTRAAYGLDNIETRFHTTETRLDIAQMRKNQSTIENIRIWDHRPLGQTFRQLQQIRTYYTFSDVEVDRYWINGTYRQVMLAARELSTDLPGKSDSWVNRHLQYTHGYGLAMCLAAEKDAQGGPVFTVADLPPKSLHGLSVSRPEIYYGTGMAGYEIVATGVNEFNYPEGDRNVYTSYAGHGGVLLDRFWKKLLFAWYQFDPSIVLSSYLSPHSRIQLWRPVQQNVTRIAPFLQLDREPYLVIDRGRLFWIQDAYTLADGFPYSEPADDGFNYIRNSVKVVVDAYQGDVRLFVMDPVDPVLRVYAAAFPGLLRPLNEMAPGLRQHLRYPRGLFDVQVDKFNTYHMTIPQVFYNREDVWAPPQEKFGGEIVQMESYYVLMKLPGEDRLQFLLMTPVTPRNRDNMIAWIAARSDFPGYGEKIVYKLSKDNLILGPLQIEAMIDQDTTIARQLTLWDQRGSRVIRGNLLVVPIDQSFLYVEPVFLLAAGANIPQLKRVIVSDGNRIAMESTLAEALQTVFSERQPTSEGTTEAPRTSATGAREALSKADQALRRGDWSAFGAEWERLKSLLEK
jgi:uncharacterized membrane protein (UPF0182 family)